MECFDSKPDILELSTCKIIQPLGLLTNHENLVKEIFRHNLHLENNEHYSRVKI